MTTTTTTLSVTCCVQHGTITSTSCSSATVEDNKIKCSVVDLDYDKMCQILKYTYLCLSPLTKMYMKTIEALRKSQVAIHFQTAKSAKKSPVFHPMTQEQMEFIDECRQKCDELERLQLDKDSVYIYLSTGKIPTVPFFSKRKHKNKRELRREMRFNRRKSTTTDTLPPAIESDDDEESSENEKIMIVEWRAKSKVMLDIYKFLSLSRTRMEDVIRQVDPGRTTCLGSLFKSKECDRWQKVVKDMTKNISVPDNIMNICTCSCLEDMLARKMEELTPEKKRFCRCTHCGMKMIIPKCPTTGGMNATSSSNNSGSKIVGTTCNGIDCIAQRDTTSGGPRIESCDTTTSNSTTNMSVELTSSQQQLLDVIGNGTCLGTCGGSRDDERYSVIIAKIPKEKENMIMNNLEKLEKNGDINVKQMREFFNANSEAVKNNKKKKSGDGRVNRATINGTSTLTPMELAKAIAGTDTGMIGSVGNKSMVPESVGESQEQSCGCKVVLKMTGSGESASMEGGESAADSADSAMILEILSKTNLEWEWNEDKTAVHITSLKNASKQEKEAFKTATDTMKIMENLCEQSGFFDAMQDFLIRLGNDKDPDVDTTSSAPGTSSTIPMPPTAAECSNSSITLTFSNPAGGVDSMQFNDIKTPSIDQLSLDDDDSDDTMAEIESDSDDYEDIIEQDEINHHTNIQLSQNISSKVPGTKDAEDIPVYHKVNALPTNYWSFHKDYFKYVEDDDDDDEDTDFYPSFIGDREFVHVEDKACQTDMEFSPYEYTSYNKELVIQKCSGRIRHRVPVAAEIKQSGFDNDNAKPEVILYPTTPITKVSSLSKSNIAQVHNSTKKEINQSASCDAVTTIVGVSYKQSPSLRKRKIKRIFRKF